MKLTAIFLFPLIFLLYHSAQASTVKMHLIIADTVPGKATGSYKQLLAADTRQAVGFFAKGGFESSAYRIILPAELQLALDTLANTQFAALAEAFIASFNRCAAKLVEYTAPDFIKTSKWFNAADAYSNGYASFINQYKLYAAEYLTSTAFAYEQHLLETTGTLAAYRKMTGAYNGLFFVHNKLNFVLEGFLSGIVVEAVFKYLQASAGSRQGNEK